MTDQKTKIPANESTQDPPSAPDLTAVITDHANVTVSALRRAMFDSDAPPATRIAAARAILDATLRMQEIEDRTAASPASQRFGEILKQRIKEARERLAPHWEEQRQKLLERSQKETGSSAGYYAAQAQMMSDQITRIPANESTQDPQSAPDLKALITDHANAAVSALRRAMFDSHAPRQPGSLRREP
jgi:hypothetical protein